MSADTDSFKRMAANVLFNAHSNEMTAIPVDCDLVASLVSFQLADCS